MPADVRFNKLLVRSLPLLVPILPLVLSIALIPLQSESSLGSFRQTVKLYRAQVSAILQVISTVLGLLNVLTVTTLVNYATRLWLRHHHMKPLDLGFLTTIALQKLDFSLPKRSVAVCLGFLSAAQIPGALWTGSLTPISTTVQKDLGSIKVPRFTADTQNIWNTQFRLESERVWNYLDRCNSSLLPSNGISYVSTCPDPDYRQQLLESASGASSATLLQRNHSKIDSPTWTYHGRSYGFGSSSGIVTAAHINPSYELTGYEYLESGYAASIHCIKNASTAFGYTVKHRDPKYETVWLMQGRLPHTPTNDSEDYPLLSWSFENENRPSPVLGWAAVSHGGRNIIAITANERYPVFNRTQCDMIFEPTHKRVHVNVTEKVITVQNITNADVSLLHNREEELEPTGTLTANVIRSIRLLSRMGSALYISDLGEPLSRNLRNLQSISRPAQDDDELRSVEDFFTAMIDDLLVAYGAAQVHYANSTAKEQPIHATFAAVRLGKDGFAFDLVAVNLLLFVGAVGEAVRTRFWEGLPEFDHTRIRDVVEAMAKAGDSGSVEEDAGDGAKVVLCPDADKDGFELLFVRCKE